MPFHWSCFIIPSHLEICSFITILVCLSLFYSLYVQKKKKEIYIYIYINVHVYVFSISIP